MKTVFTLVIDEDLHRFGWRVDRNESKEVLAELYKRLLDSDENCKHDALEEMEPISAQFESILKEDVLPELDRQLEPYVLFNPAEHTSEVL